MDKPSEGTIGEKLDAAVVKLLGALGWTADKVRTATEAELQSLVDDPDEDFDEADMVYVLGCRTVLQWGREPVTVLPCETCVLQALCDAVKFEIGMKVPADDASLVAGILSEACWLMEEHLGPFYLMRAYQTRERAQDLRDTAEFVEGVEEAEVEKEIRKIPPEEAFRDVGLDEETEPLPIRPND